jgi:diacylglycerol kinase family enzyme
VAAGGDGSLHHLVATLYGSGALSAEDPIGLLPLGTGNDFARTVGVPLDPAAAARAVVDGRPRRLDLLVDDAGGVVVNVVHLGIGAEGARRGTPLKPALGTAAYAVGAAAAGVTSAGWSVRVEVDGLVVHDTHVPVLLVALANGRSIGGGSALAPRAEPDDGLADVIVATSTGPLARLGFAVTMPSGDHVQREDVESVRGRVVRVSGDEIPVNADGELSTGTADRTWRVHAGAWSLLVP